MSILDGLKNFLQLINDNWTLIICIIGLAMALYRKIESYLSKSTDEKIALAKDQIRVSMLKLITDAEVEYESWSESGAIKRAQVIDQIYKEYPILERVANQDELIEWLDEQIDAALVTLRDVLKANNTEEV